MILIVITQWWGDFVNTQKEEEINIYFYDFTYTIEPQSSTDDYCSHLHILSL